jgi:hypothetical protein
MKRRAFFALIGGAIAAWIAPVRAEDPMPEVGFLHVGSPGPFAALVAAFGKGLSETGFIVDQNVKIEYRWAEDRYDRVPVLANELVKRRVAALAASAVRRRQSPPRRLLRLFLSFS